MARSRSRRRKIKKISDSSGQLTCGYSRVPWEAETCSPIVAWRSANRVGPEAYFVDYVGQDCNPARGFVTAHGADHESADGSPFALAWGTNVVESNEVNVLALAVLRDLQ